MRGIVDCFGDDSLDFDEVDSSGIQSFGNIFIGCVKFDLRKIEDVLPWIVLNLIILHSALAASFSLGNEE